MSWTAPNDNGADITDYDVQYRDCTNANDLTCASNASWSAWTNRSGETAADTDTSVTLTGLTDGTKHEVRVRAANSVDESAWSPVAAATPAAQKPTAPTAPRLTVANQSLAVSWTAPAANGASITDYDVQYRACTNTSDLTCATNPAWAQDWTDRSGETASDTDTSVTLDGLTNGTAYQVQVRAANSVGESSWSAASSEHPSTAPGVPAAPSLTVKDRRLDVSWAAPTSNGGARHHRLRRALLHQQHRLRRRERVDCPRRHRRQRPPTPPRRPTSQD